MKKVFDLTDYELLQMYQLRVKFNHYSVSEEEPAYEEDELEAEIMRRMNRLEQDRLESEIRERAR